MKGRTVTDLRALFSFICMWPHQVFGNTKRKSKELSEDCLYLLLLFAHPSLRFKDRVRIAGPRENKSCKLYVESVTTTSGVPWILGGGRFNNRKNIHKDGSQIQRLLRTKERSWHTACVDHSLGGTTGASPDQNLF